MAEAEDPNIDTVRQAIGSIDATLEELRGMLLDANEDLAELDAEIAAALAALRAGEVNAEDARMAIGRVDATLEKMRARLQLANERFAAFDAAVATALSALARGPG